MRQRAFTIAPAMISGRTPGPAMFAPPAASVFNVALGGHGLGQTPMEWYRRARTAVSRFEDLRARVSRIAAVSERQRLEQWIGSASDAGSPLYRYNSVKSDLADVERTTPLEQAVRQYEVERRTNRIEKLEAFDNELEAMVVNAENVYGRLPGPVVVERERVVTREAAPDWTTPVVVGAGAVAAAIAISLLVGGR